MGGMIWAFEQALNYDDDAHFFDWSEVDRGVKLTEQFTKVKIDREGLDAHHDRKANGYRLFGKYYQCLWD